MLLKFTLHIILWRENLSAVHQYHSKHPKIRVNDLIDDFPVVVFSNGHDIFVLADCELFLVILKLLFCQYSSNIIDKYIPLNLFDYVTVVLHNC